MQVPFCLKYVFEVVEIGHKILSLFLWQPCLASNLVPENFAQDLIEAIVASGLGVRQITTDDDDGTLSLAEEVQKWVIPTSVERVRRVRCKRRNILLGIEGWLRIY